MIKLSIIIPYYKTLELTKQLLNTLVPQLTKECECILIDDGCNELEFDKYPITVIHKENGGVSKARNTGLDKATGEYIVFIDSDDMIKSNYIETILNKIKTTEFDYCFFSWEATGRLKGQYIIKNNPPSWNTCVWNCIYKREKIGRFDTTKTIAEDEDFNNKYRKGIKANIEDILYIYNSGREDSLTDRYSKGIITRTQEETIKTQIAVFQSRFGDIGGIEKSLFEYFKALKDDYDIIFFYKDGNFNQLKRYKKLVKCIKYTGQKIICNKYLCNSTYDNIADNVNSLDNYYAQIIHSDYSSMEWRYNKHPKTNVHIAVSEIAKNSILKQCPSIPCKVIYNLLEVDKPQRVLKLISPTRFSWEKGYDRVIQMAKRLKQKNIPFIWQVFTNEPLKDNIDGLVKRDVTFNIDSYISDCDYLVQLSNCESWGYSTAQALELGVPIICTDYPAIHEQGLINGKNGYILKMDMSNLDELIDNIYKNNLKGFKYAKKDNKQQWIDELGKMVKENNYIPEEIKGTEVQVIKPCFYSKENQQCEKGDTLIIETEERLNDLINRGYVKLI